MGNNIYRQKILNSILKGVLAESKNIPLLKGIATFIAELSSYSVNDIESIDTSLDNEMFCDLLVQMKIVTENATLALVGVENLKKIIDNIQCINTKQLKKFNNDIVKNYDQFQVDFDIFIKCQSDEHKRQEQKLDLILDAIKIAPEVKNTIRNIFNEILNDRNIPEHQWAEKLELIASKYKEIKNKTSTSQSFDPVVNQIRSKARENFNNGNYRAADNLLLQAIQHDDEVIERHQEFIAKRNLSKSQTLAFRATLAEIALNYDMAILLLNDAILLLSGDKSEFYSDLNVELGSLLYLKSNYTDAIKCFEVAISIDSNEKGPLSWRLVRDKSNLALVYKKQGKLSESKALFEFVLKQVVRFHNLDHPNVASCINNLAGAYMEDGDFENAKQLYLKSLEIYEKKRNDNILDIGSCLNNLAGLYTRLGNFESADDCFQQVYEIYEEYEYLNHPNAAACFVNWADLKVKINDFEKAENCYTKAIAIYEAVYGSIHPNLAICLNNMANLYERLGKIENAINCSEKHLTIFLKLSDQLGLEHYYYMVAINNFVGILMSSGQSKEEALKRVSELKSEILGS